MKRFPRFVRYLLILLALAAVAAFLFVQSLKPDYQGEVSLSGLDSPVEVFYDTYGIPHIYAGSEADALRALGYVHAQDRLWQMELLRRIARGRLSEVFGDLTLDTDKFFLTLGIADATAETLKQTDTLSDEFRLARAYLDGVNSFVDEGPTPVEFYLTGIDKAHFNLEDLYNTVGYMAFSFAMAHKTDPFLEDIKKTLGPEYLETLLEDCPDCTEVIETHRARTRPDAAPSDSTATVAGLQKQAVGQWGTAIRALMRHLPVPAFEGSNSWVLAPEKTSSGAVILANDPHIGFAQPSVWYEAHLKTPDYERYGYHLGGVPFPLLAHNRENAYGLTMFENDDIDFYREQVDSQRADQYLRNGSWEAFDTVVRTILVKGGDPVEFAFRKTDYGPVVNDVIDAVADEAPVSMRWVYTEGPNRLIQALYGMTHAKDLRQFEAAVSDIHAPGLNVMYGDSSGSIAWWAAARLHTYPDSVSTKTFLDGGNQESRWRKPVPFQANPRAVNPPWNYVYSANNQPDSTAIGFVPGYYLPENRAVRITELLEEHDQWNREAVSEMILDVNSPVNTKIITSLASAIAVPNLSEGELECLDRINGWDGTYDLGSREALIYHRWIYYLFKNVFEDELGTEGVAALMDTHLFKRLIARLADHPEWVWWDNIDTERQEQHTEQINRSFEQALSSLRRDFGADATEWQWGKAHTLEFKHPIGEVALLRSFFNIGPFPVRGSREVINNMSFPYDSTGYYRVSSGPSTRRVIDFSDIENSLSILPTGQSGNPLSPHYDDQADMYIQGEFRKMMMNRQEIESTSRAVLTFSPTSN